MAPFDLIIFDCDGVLVDSEPLAMRVLIGAIAAQGHEIKPEYAYRHYLGRSLASISASLLDSHGDPLGPAALEAMRTRLFELYRTELKPSPGLKQALERLQTPVCVASSSSLERIRISLDLTGLSPWFGDHVYSASMVENGKPAPDLFLHAARTMHTEPARCLVIEDSPAGIKAAQAAGMAVFAYLGGSHAIPGGLAAQVQQLKPDAVFHDMHALPDLLSFAQTDKKAL